ncbi:hypothetical protein YWA314_12691 [Yersinia enterocolitica subsp. enterocolitica WA-314]|uniref:Uncharacterized protein n=1 Tax=Yersinia enterocolitica serotype O:8 / biotype 1B (strain NCTC 13174 / 8081) TaxID=393305 RepID=A1JKE8_YERE8|nr:hypothetical protein YWA314_12691 [Yersinia enterocolitica subsp. enterocolitica WA-314]CAL11060.1 hypothetical protein YE0962 [Yersinia enterocolitica subsp. enterocolitica 8081]
MQGILRYKKHPRHEGVRLLTNLDNSILQGEGRQKSKASAPRKGLRRLYDLPVFTVTGTLSLTSHPRHEGVFMYICR